MTPRNQTRAAASSLYAAAILLAVFFAHGTVIAAVAAVGGVLVGMVYRMTAAPGEYRDRSARRSARRGYGSSL